jgi:hypothetical protein
LKFAEPMLGYSYILSDFRITWSPVSDFCVVSSFRIVRYCPRLKDYSAKNGFDPHVEMFDSLSIRVVTLTNETALCMRLMRYYVSFYIIGAIMVGSRTGPTEAGDPCSSAGASVQTA